MQDKPCVYCLSVVLITGSRLTSEGRTERTHSWWILRIKRQMLQRANGIQALSDEMSPRSATCFRSKSAVQHETLWHFWTFTEQSLLLGVPSEPKRFNCFPEVQGSKLDHNIYCIYSNFALFSSGSTDINSGLLSTLCRIKLEYLSTHNNYCIWYIIIK